MIFTEFGSWCRKCHECGATIAYKNKQGAELAGKKSLPCIFCRPSLITPNKVLRRKNIVMV